MEQYFHTSRKAGSIELVGFDERLDSPDSFYMELREYVEDELMALADNRTAKGREAGEWKRL